MTDAVYSIEDLCRLTGLTRRTIRYYIQEGLVPKPEGERRAAHYLNSHLEILLRIRRLTASGLSLEAVRSRLTNENEDTEPMVHREPGTFRSCIHVTVANGIELTIDPAEAKLSPEATRHFVTDVMALIEKLQSEKP